MLTSAPPAKLHSTSSPQPEAAATLAAELGCSSLIAQLLITRGITTPTAGAQFLSPKMADLADPMLLPDAELAVARIARAIAEGEQIAIHGDYDSDGVTSAALWTRLLTVAGAHVTVHVPHRKDDGYDIRSAFIQRASQAGAGLILTTDCGIRRVAEVEEARAAGLDVIITDHHQPGAELPRAVAVVNPHRSNSAYPFKDLAGVGVAFRLGEALARRLDLPIESYRSAYGDLAAIGTITDVVPLVGENRIIVRHGLSVLGESRKPGLKALMQSARVVKRPITAADVGFRIGPRLNAAGRLDDSRIALDLLLERDDQKARMLAATMEQLNQDRRVEQKRVVESARLLTADWPDVLPSFLVFAGEGWHPGVVGIAAGTLAEQFNRPALVLSWESGSGMARGSGRSIAPFHLLQALNTCSDLMHEYGGHSHAAGLSIPITAIDELRSRLQAYSSAVLTTEDLVPVVYADIALDPAQVTMELVADLDQLQPYGNGNPEPIFACSGMNLKEAVCWGRENLHLRITAEAPGSRPVTAIMWGGAHLVPSLIRAGMIDICYRIERDDYNGGTGFRINLVDAKPTK